LPTRDASFRLAVGGLRQVKERDLTATAIWRQKSEGHLAVKVSEASAFGGIVNSCFCSWVLSWALAGAALLGYAFQRRISHRLAEVDREAKLAKMRRNGFFFSPRSR